jgi:hypothetical protein
MYRTRQAITGQRSHGQAGSGVNHPGLHGVVGVIGLTSADGFGVIRAAFCIPECKS